MAQQAPSQVRAQEKWIQVATKNTGRNHSTLIHYSLNLETECQSARGWIRELWRVHEEEFAQQDTTEAHHCHTAP